MSKTKKTTKKAKKPAKKPAKKTTGRGAKARQASTQPSA